jgi:hypothetical protein
MAWAHHSSSFLMHSSADLLLVAGVSGGARLGL